MCMQLKFCDFIKKILGWGWLNNRCVLLCKHFQHISSKTNMYTMYMYVQVLV